MASYWYRTGTAALTQGSKVITINGAQLASAGLSAGDMFTRDGGQWYEIERIDGSEITLASPYAGESEAEAPYAVIRLTFLSTTNAQLAVRLANLLHDWQQRESQLREWHGGTLDGGPNGDGRYPLSDGFGNTHLVPCPAWFGRAGELAYDFEQELERVLEARDQAVSARDAAVPAAQTATQAAQATGEDRAAVAGMKQTAEQAAQTATDKAAQAEQDAQATAADRHQTGLDVQATAQHRQAAEGAAQTAGEQAGIATQKAQQVSQDAQATADARQAVAVDRSVVEQAKTDAEAAATTAVQQVGIVTTKADEAASSATAAAGYETKARDWATKTDAEVEPGAGYGAKKYAEDAAASAAQADGALVAAVRKDEPDAQAMVGALLVEGDKPVWHAGNLTFTYDPDTKSLDITTG